MITPETRSILVIDDEPQILRLFRRAFEKNGVSVSTSDNAVDGLSLVSETSPDAVVLDIVLPDVNGLEVLERIQSIDAKLPVVIITGTGTSDTAIKAMKMGALDYLVKPLDLAKVRAVVDKALAIRQLMQQPSSPIETSSVSPLSEQVLVGQCPAIQEVYKSIGRVASQDVTVLIRGESGTGKELVARALYEHSDRTDGPFMAVSCAAIPEALLESELFGHEQGAFTGADRQRIGKFEQCSGGTLFLDEIGDMSLPLQSKMLRVLQEQEFERVGGNLTIQTDVRIIAATNRALEKMVVDGQFRSDLYYRLNGYTVTLPALRDRGDDLILLISHFLARANRETKKDVKSVSPAAMKLLKDYSWPGNIRELQSVIKQAVLQTTGPVLLAEFLPASLQWAVANSDQHSPGLLPFPLPGQSPREEHRETHGMTHEETHGQAVELGGGATSGNALLRGVSPGTPSSVDRAPFEQFIDGRLADGSNVLYDEALARMERKLISRVLRHTSGNQVEAARILGVTRTTLRTKIQKLGIKIDRVVHADDEVDEA